MKMENKKNLRYAAGACFAVLAILFVTKGFAINNINGILTHLLNINVNAWKVLASIGAAMIAASFFTSLPILSTVGSVLCAVSATRTFAVLSASRVSIFKIIACVLFFVTWVLLAIGGISKNITKYTGFASTATSAFYTVTLFLMHKRDFLIHSSDYIVPVLMIAGSVLLALSSETDKKTKPIPANVKAAVPAGGGLSQTERLIKLKSLLDSGVITQEEFDAKKKDIMG